MPIRRTRRIVRKPRSTRRLKQSFSAYGMDRLAAAYKRGAFGGMRGTRRKGWIQSDKAMITRSTNNATGGDYSQFTEKRIQTGRKKKTTFARLVKEVRQKAETSIFRFGGMNQGPGANGFFWCNKYISADATNDSLPLYMYDLTSVVNVVNGVNTPGQPLYRAKTTIADGSITWDYVQGQDPSGALTYQLQNEKIPSTSTVLDYPHDKSRLLWTDVRLNLYGAKTKAIKWTIQVVKLLDDCLDPIPTNVPTSPNYEFYKKNSFYQGLIKPYTYNPLALTSAGQVSRRLKVLKTYTTVIQPVSSTESDTNPHTKVLKWFMRWDRDMSYAQRGNVLTSGNAFIDDADYATQVNQAAPYTKSASKIFLMIRACDYSVQSQTNTNSTHGSFDMTIRACHVPM